MDIIIFFSKYLFLFFIAVLTFSCGVTILQEQNKIKLNLKNPSMMILMVFHILASVILIFNEDFSINYDALIFCCVIVAFIIFVKTIMHFLYFKSDELIVNLMLFFMDIGFLFQFRLNQSIAYRQLVFAFVATICCTLIPLLFKFFTKGYTKYRSFDYLFIFLIFATLLLPFISGTEEVYGARNWAHFNILGGITFQPSEIAKVLFIFYLASAFSRSKSIYDLVIPTMVSFFAILILVAQVDFGGSLIFFSIYLILLFVTTSSKLLLGLGISAITIASIFAYNFVYHVKVRVDIFLDPFASPYNEGMQILQSLFAIGTKAPFGAGFTKGYPSFVPVVESDFIFAGFAEEFGAIFAIFVIMLFFVFFLRGIKISRQSNEKYLILLSLGISCCFALQAFLIIGGNIKLIPLTGVTLPFISYGGTSVFISIIMVTILLRIDLMNLLCEDDYKPLQLTRANISKVYMFYAIVYAILIIFMNKVVFIDSPKIISTVYNPRVSIVDDYYVRGEILDRNGETLAYSKRSDDGTLNRYYPYDNVFAHTVGSNSKGKIGLELTNNFKLADASNELFQMSKKLFFDDDVYADSIKTTLDLDLQKYAYEQLGNRKGSVVVQETSTGKILAMVSYNNFNPNSFNSDFETLKGDETNTPLINRATQGQYPPGSVFKIISSLDIIHNFDDYENYTYTCNGFAEINGEKVTCNHGAVHGEVDLQKAFEVSCNSYFASVIESMDNSTLKDEAELCMYNQKVDFDLPMSESTFVLNKSSETGETMHTAIGQGNTLTTILNMNMVTQSVANGGVMLQPYLVESIIKEDGKVKKTYQPKVLTKTMSPDDAKILTDMMVKVVENGTATNAKLDNGIQSAGKTGTAEVLNKESHGIYTAFAPTDNPQICVTVILENGGSSANATPIARNIMNFYFKNN